MVSFKIIDNTSKITLNNKWTSAANFESKGKVVNEKGHEIGSDYQGRKYRIIEKKERIFSTSERLSRGFLGLVLIISTLCLALLSKFVRNLLVQSKEGPIYFAVPVRKEDRSPKSNPSLPANLPIRQPKTPSPRITPNEPPNSSSGSLASLTPKTGDDQNKREDQTRSNNLVPKQGDVPLPTPEQRKEKLTKVTADTPHNPNASDTPNHSSSIKTPPSPLLDNVKKNPRRGKIDHLPDLLAMGKVRTGTEGLKHLDGDMVIDPNQDLTVAFACCFHTTESQKEILKLITDLRKKNDLRMFFFPKQDIFPLIQEEIDKRERFLSQNDLMHEAQIYTLMHHFRLHLQMLEKENTTIDFPSMSEKEKRKLIKKNQFAPLNQDLILKLEALKDSNDKFQNTGMTHLLLDYTFTSKIIPIEMLNDLLKSLAQEALSRHNQHARLALTQPNNPKELISENCAKGGFPQNTPLALLIKAGNLQGSQMILPVYEKEDLLFANPRNNTALHLAMLTGQFALVVAIIKRAKELNCLDELLAIKNKVGKTAEDMYWAVIKPANPFKNFLDIAEENFGGEEINKALIGHQLVEEKFPLNKKLLLAEIEEWTSLSFTQLKNMNFSEVLNHIKEINGFDALEGSQAVSA